MQCWGHKIDLTLGHRFSKFLDINFIDNVTCNNLWKFQGNRLFGIALTSIQTFYEVKSLYAPGDLTLSDLDLKFWQPMRNGVMNRRACSKRRLYAPLFPGNMGKPEAGGGGGVSITAPPSGQRLIYYAFITNYIRSYFIPNRREGFSPFTHRSHSYY